MQKKVTNAYCGPLNPMGTPQLNAYPVTATQPLKALPRKRIWGQGFAVAAEAGRLLSVADLIYCVFPGALVSTVRGCWCWLLRIRAQPTGDTQAFPNHRMAEDLNNLSNLRNNY